MASFNDLYIEQLKELVTCALCLEHYQDPRLLPCSHTFCFHCIQKAVKNDNNFDCPFKDGMKINKNSIPHLPSNQAVKDSLQLALSVNLSTDKKFFQQCNNCSEYPAVNWCDKCAAHLCPSCIKSIHSNNISQSHTIVPLTEKVLSYCMEHPDEKFKYWCKQCEVLVCRDCSLFQHKNHTFLQLKEAVSQTKTKFQANVQEIDKIKRSLTKFSETTKSIISQRHGIVRQQKQNIEQTFAKLQRMLEERKRTIIKQLEDKESGTMELLQHQQNTIDQHLNLTIVQEFCLKKMLDSNDQIQILKFETTLSHTYKDFTTTYSKIDKGYKVMNHKFVKKGKDIQQILGLISELGDIKTESKLVNGDRICRNTILLNISKPVGEIKFSLKAVKLARGYRFQLKQPFRLHSILIQSDYTGQHVGLVINDVNVVVSNGTVNSNDSTMKWLTIPLKCDIQNKYSVIVWASSGYGSYAYKDGDNPFPLRNTRAVNQNCSVESVSVDLVESKSAIGSNVSISDNAYSIEMIISIELEGITKH